MIELHTAATGNGRRPAVMLEECGLPYKLHKIDLAKGEQKQPAFLALNPLGAIPVMVDTDGPGGQRIALSQSAAMLLYLADKTGKFLPKDPVRRAVAQQWLLHVMSDQQPTSTALFIVASLPDKPASAVAKFEGRLLDFFRFADRRLGEAQYLADELSIADFALYPIAMARREMIDKASGMDNLRRWMAALGARPAVTRGMQAPG
jgi:GST-like protein